LATRHRREIERKPAPDGYRFFIDFNDVSRVAEQVGR
jgi:hypothetical protein